PGVSMTDPDTVPLFAAETVRSANDIPRRPIAAPWWRRAVVAGDRSPSNVPFTVSIEPFRTAVAEPTPATVLRIATSIGTGDRRTLKRASLCAPAGRAGANAMSSATAARREV